MGTRRLRSGVPVVVGAVALLGAVPALAYVCHPDAPGTRTLAVHGQVLGYSVQGASVSLRVRAADGCTRLLVWHTSSRAAAARPATVVIGGGVGADNAREQLELGGTRDGVMLLLGSAAYAHPDGTRAGVAAAVDAIG